MLDTFVEFIEIYIRSVDCCSYKSEDGKVHIPEELVARDMAHALVQIARGVETRFMTHPLCEKTIGCRLEICD